MQDKLELSSALASSLGTCAVGDTKTVEVTGTVTATGKGGLVLEVSGVKPTSEGDYSNSKSPMPKAVEDMMGGDEEA